MKREYRHALATAVGMLLCASAWAQSPRDDAPLGSGNFEESIAFADHLGGGDLRASELLGRRVLDAEGEEVGEIEDLIVSPGDETVTAILSVGGFLEVGSKLIGVPYDELRVSPGGEDFYLAMSAEEVEAQPEYRFEAEERQGAEREAASVGSQDGGVPGATGTPGPEERAAGEAAADVVVEQREQREAVSRRTVVANSDDSEVEDGSARDDRANDTHEDSGQADADRPRVEASGTGERDPLR